MSWIFTFINTIFSFIAGIIATISYISNPLTDPFILEIFTSNSPKTDDINFRVTNTTKHSLDTKVEITPIILDSKQETQEFNMVLNPEGKYEKNLIGDYGNIRDFNTKHDLNSTSYENNRQPVKFLISACFKDSRLKVLKYSNCTENLRVFQPRGKEFLRIK